MLSTTASLPQAALSQTIQETCGRIAPLWPLQSFVAVNPFLGLTAMPFADAAERIERVGHGSIFLTADDYLARLNNGELHESAIQQACAIRGLNLPSGQASSWLAAELQMESASDRVLTVADWIDHHQPTQWAAFITDEISKWCSSYFDLGQSAWHMPGRDASLLDAWKLVASIDANPEVAGMTGFRSLMTSVCRLPNQAEAIVQWALDELKIPQPLLAEYLHRLLVSIQGWSAYAAYQDRQSGQSTVLPQLLAIRIVYDVALLRQASGWSCIAEAKGEKGGAFALEIAQCALENTYRAGLVRKLTSSEKKVASARPELQAVFCIDVRSEVFRRALEAQSNQIATIGFAGFFGMSLQVGDTARCPVLLSPRHNVHECDNTSKTGRVLQSLQQAWQGLRRSTAGCFSSVEVGGLLSGATMLNSVWHSKSTNTTAPAKLTWNIPLEERIALAAGALKGMSLDAATLAPVVLICGHGARTTNNPYAAGLDCGACGGHAGDINARFAAALFNDAEVRTGLAKLGTVLPADTVFVAGLHVTTTDEVELLDVEALPPGKLEQLRAWLQAAGHASRRERNPDFLGDIDAEVKRRSGDWAEVRPEWGLAGNAAFIAAPRSRTASLNLGGRTFLHDYDEALDPEGSVLSLILNAPVVVASWINLQYFASTVNNKLFGSGNKVLHNVVGTFGVWEGNAGDLRTGLPLQSLHDGEKWMHQPLRLQVIVETKRERMDQVLRNSPEVRNLVENEWIHLISLEGNRMFQCRKAGEWNELNNTPSSPV